MRSGRAWVAWVGWCLGGAVAWGLAGPGAAQEPDPEPAVARWEVPGELVLPLDELLDRGFVLLQRNVPAGGQELALVRTATGEVDWTAPVTGGVVSVNLAEDVLVVGLRDQVLGIDARNGTQVWRQPLTFPMDQGWAVPVQFRQSQWFADRSIHGSGIGGGLLTIGDQFFLCVQGTVFAADALTGTIAWQRKLCFSLSFPLMSYGDLVLAATSDQGFGALRAEDGSTAWGHALNRIRALFQVDEELYVATGERRLLRLDPATGEILWECPLEGQATMKLTGVGDRLVAQLDQEALFLSRADGTILWRQQHPSLKSTLRDGLLCYRDGDKGPLVCVNVADGSVRWTAPSIDGGVWSVHAAPGTLVLLSPGMVEGLDLATGTAHWSRISGPGVLFDTATWTNSDDAVFVHLPNETRGYLLGDGRYRLKLPGQYSFVHWMQVRQDTLLLHSGAPGKLAAIPLAWRLR